MAGGNANAITVDMNGNVWLGTNPGGNVGVIGVLGALLFILYSLAIFLIAWLNEEFDLFILTNQRLIDITQVSFLKRTATDF